MTDENEFKDDDEGAFEERVNKNVYLISLVREPVFPKDAYTVNEVARLLCISRNRVMGYATRPRDPLPLRRWENGAKGELRPARRAHRVAPREHRARAELLPGVIAQENPLPQSVAVR